MKLRSYTLEKLAEIVVGDNALFPYRSSTYITSFFRRCDLDYEHDGTTRKWWTHNVLTELNEESSSTPDLPSDPLIRVITEVFDPDDFDRHGKNRENALEELNRVVGKNGLAGYFDDTGRCFLRNTGTGVSSTPVLSAPRPLSKEEIAIRHQIESFLNDASEDEFTEQLLVPFFQSLGFHRVSAAGHKEKSLEYGKDLWMKYRLPTSHWIYFCAQVKRGKIDAGGAGGANNAANVLTQVKMAIDYPIFDPESNRKVLLDHVFVIAAGEITRAAQNWIVERLDTSQRRHIIFMDRSDFLDQSARIIQLPTIQQACGGAVN